MIKKIKESLENTMLLIEEYEKILNIGKNEQDNRIIGINYGNEETKEFDENICTVCNKTQDPVKGAKVIEFSNNKYGKTICYFCQQKM